MTYLHRPAKPGIHEYICKKLQSFPEDAIGEPEYSTGLRDS